MSNGNNKDENTFSVRTPWGNLAKSQALQATIDSLKDDLTSLNKRIRDIEKEKSSSNTSYDAITKILSDYETRIKHVESKMSELESKFERFSSKTLQILEQLRKGTF